MNLALPPAKSPLTETVIDRLTKEHVTPRSRWFFRSRECIVWGLWGISIMVGAMVLGIVLFVVRHRQYALYEATHDNFVTFAISALPYLWIVTFGSLVIFALYNLRHTRHGYRYPIGTILVSSVALSALGGVLFHSAGYGFALDRYLGEQLAMYQSEIKKEKKLWQAPEAGRLLGQFVFSTVVPTSTIIFSDNLGGRWVIDVTDLTPEELVLLESKDMVRMFGQPVNLQAKLFHACGVFPWLLHTAPPGTELAKGREAFEKKSMMYIKSAKVAVEEREMQLKLNRELGLPPPDIHCAEMEPVQRMRQNRGME